MNFAHSYSSMPTDTNETVMHSDLEPKQVLLSHLSEASAKHALIGEKSVYDEKLALSFDGNMPNYCSRPTPLGKQLRKKTSISYVYVAKNMSGHFNQG